MRSTTLTIFFKVDQLLANVCHGHRWSPVHSPLHFATCLLDVGLSPDTVDSLPKFLTRPRARRGCAREWTSRPSPRLPIPFLPLFSCPVMLVPRTGCLPR